MKTKAHYHEADLLETYYMAPGESLPIMLHLGSCSPCRERYEAVERKIRGAGDHACSTEQPDTFWARQRLSIMRRIDVAPPAHAPRRPRWARIAAAAAVVCLLTLGGISFLSEPETVTPPVPRVAVVDVETSQDVIGDIQERSDPWGSESLSEYRDVVEWESWISEEAPSPGESL